MNSRKSIKIRELEIGGAAPVSVQSMCNTKTWDVEATVGQINAFKAAGCDIVRIAIPDMKSAQAVSEIREKTDMPLVADIHFDYRLALEAAERGIDKIRINPGNIGGSENVKKVADACRKRNIPIRIGVNAGSLEKTLLEKYGHPCPEAMAESAEGHIKLLNRYDFDDICISMKSSSVSMTVANYRLAKERFSYPLHLGVTETGTSWNGTIQSAVGIGTLLNEGIGDTIRVSLTADPVEEVKAGIAILKACGLRKNGVRFISCPTCGRTEIDLISLADEVEEKLKDISKDITVAVMGCVVNGPGEAREADFGIAGGVGKGILFKKGEVLGTYPYSELSSRLMDLINGTED
ncbi:MAG: flavodoxin-dependent (E)-4-hydroxy-3-methylbut-2-enyl-diphosphate synthase [Oscillospiraceae bacterium]|jgi:(E)-4-hydroxy-3-methylbut-2-enyl-diphosphate synthase|nr:flavodoxin-dependent (E)-4-hydroxy-3-methylbut-2-enyl-diphosphate synthase [Oscillospiraceae bacterium]MBQ2145765.1 flavodoxin-dependent (E)-4-hydroxy-3-methylbut-2-enyl-diphosphate synthase [Oscillospiraceae bacterium]MBQ5489844.1 flavodoxin-dependent (E)-4-hydroxy-3-methylbut-2-enyl-diphosphate synthase [Oscillospiraceae bacterium]